MAAARKKTPKRRRSHSVTVRDLKNNNPSIADQIENRMEPWKRKAVMFTAFGAACLMAYQAWFFLGWPAVITDHALERVIIKQNEAIDGKIGTVKTEVNTRIDSTKNEVVTNQNAIKSEITGSLGEVTKTLGAVVKNQNASAMESSEMAMKLAFTQLQSLQGQLATWKQALVKDPADQAAQLRVMQIESFIKQNEKDMQDAKDKLNRLRNGP